MLQDTQNSPEEPNLDNDCKALLEKAILPRISLASSNSAMPNQLPFCYFKTSQEVIQLAVMLYVRFRISLRNVENLLNERGVVGKTY